MKSPTNFKDLFHYYTDLGVHKGSALKKQSSGRPHKMTLEKLALALGYKSPSSLSMLATGQRLPSKELLEKLMTLWKLPAQQKKVLRLQLEIDKKNQKGKDTLKLLSDLKKADPQAHFTTLNMDVFESIKDWHYYAIQYFAGAPSFSEDPEELSRLLRRKVSPAKVKKALAHLEKIGTLKRNPITQKLERTLEATETTHDIPSAAIRHHHKGMIGLALDAIDEQSVENRSLSALTFRVDPKSIPEIKKRIFEFTKLICDSYANDSADILYQMNLQLFELTQLSAKDKESKS